MSRTSAVVISHDRNDRSLGTYFTLSRKVAHVTTATLRLQLLVFRRICPLSSIFIEEIEVLFEELIFPIPNRLSLSLSVLNMSELVCEKINRSGRSVNYGIAVFGRWVCDIYVGRAANWPLAFPKTLPSDH